MLPCKINSINIYIFAVTITFIISSLNNNKIIVNSYQLNSFHKINNSTRINVTSLPSSASSSSSSSLSSLILHNEQIKTQNHKLNHHLKSNNKFAHNVQQKEHLFNQQEQEQPTQRQHNLSENEKYNIPFDKKYLHHIPKSSSSSLFSSSSEINNQNKESNKNLDLKNNEYPRDIHYPLLLSISETSNNNHHNIVDEAAHPFSFSNKNTKSQQQYYNHHHHQQHQHHSSNVNLKKQYQHSTPPTTLTTIPTNIKPLKLQNELHQHKSLDHNNNNHHHHHHHQHHRHKYNVTSTINNEKLKESNEKKLQSILTSKSYSIEAISPTSVTLTLQSKNSLPQNKIMSQQHQRNYLTSDINASKSKFHHKIEATPKHSSELNGRHHHNQYHNHPHHHHQKQKIQINKNHILDDINHDENDDQVDIDEIDNSNDEDYYYYIEDRNNDNHHDNDNHENYEDDDDDDNTDINDDDDDDEDNNNDDSNLELEVKGGKINEKHYHNTNKGIILNRDYHDSEDIDLIKKDAINHDVYNNFEKDFDLYDYIDDEPRDETTKNNGKTENLTEEKWEKLGTATAVVNSRRRYYSQVQNVNAHIMRVGHEAECKVPKPKVIQINEPSKRFVPHCTVLHRCGDDTGCCQSDFRTCVMKKSQTIDLYFYVVHLGMKEPKVEMLSFENHTECHCIERKRNRSPSQPMRNESENLIEDKEKQNKPNATQNLHSSLCQCVKHFTIFEESNRYDNSDYQNTDDNKPKCRCDCVSNDDVCQRFKKGEEGFSVDDRKCVTDNRCTTPTCQYGDYSIQNGRCPKNIQKRYIRTWHFD